MIGITLIGDAMARPLVEASPPTAPDYDLSGLAVIGSRRRDPLAGGARSSCERAAPARPDRSTASARRRPASTGTMRSGSRPGPRFGHGRPPCSTTTLRPVAPGSGRGRPAGPLAGTSRSATTRTTRRPRPRSWSTPTASAGSIPGDFATVEADGDDHAVSGGGSVCINTGRREDLPRRGRGGAEDPPRGVRRRRGRRARRAVRRARRRGRQAATGRDARRSTTLAGARPHARSRATRCRKEMHVRRRRSQRTPVGQARLPLGEGAGDRARRRGGVVSAPEFHLYLPQMRLSMDAMVEKAQRRRGGRLRRHGGHGPPRAADGRAARHVRGAHDQRVVAGPHRTARAGSTRAVRRVPASGGAGA